MTTVIDIPEDQVQALDALCAEYKVTQAELIRQALAAYFAQHTPPGHDCPTWTNTGFGLWKDRAVDGLEYQEKIRAEWDR